MLMRTHLVITLCMIFLLFQQVQHSKIVFVVMALLATILPDIDTGFSTIGKFKIFRPLQVFTKHRGIIHSLTLCVAISVVLAFFLQVAAFGFFLGYSLHLLADMFTKEGISVFWPIKKKAQGFVRTGSMLDTSIFLVFVVADIFLLIFLLMV